MSKIEQIKVPVSFEDPKMNWRLKRVEDGLVKESERVTWLEFDEQYGTLKERHDEPAVGRSLLMSPFNRFFTWQTTYVTEILEQKEGYIKFKTRNSTYELWQL
jgi:hypothetical protein